MNPYLLTTFEMGPAVVRRIIEHIPESSLDRAIDPERFTPREVVAHLADWEAIDRKRLSAGVERPGSAIQPYDEVQMALDHQYSQSDINAQLLRYANERKVTARYVRGLRPDDMRNTVYHPERGILTVDDLCNLIIAHDLYHVEQLSAYLEQS